MIEIIVRSNRTNPPDRSAGFILRSRARSSKQKAVGQEAKFMYMYLARRRGRTRRMVWRRRMRAPRSSCGVVKGTWRSYSLPCPTVTYILLAFINHQTILLLIATMLMTIKQIIYWYLILFIEPNNTRTCFLIITVLWYII